MNDAASGLWSQALAHFDRLQDLREDRRQQALAELERSEPELARRVRGLFAADAGATTQAEAAASVRIAPPRIAGYAVGELLGQGGMGEVFAAQRRVGDFEQAVALKRMLLGRHAAQVHERFLRERRILAQLDHPHIARLLDGGLDEDGHPFFAMERVDGVPITQYVRQHGLDLRATLALFVVVCEAVAYAHRNLIVHRDIKPSNVLVDGEGRIKLLDFGIAKLLNTGPDDATQSLALTPAYAAPEQLLGEPVSTATDVYSLGLLLYELLAGEPPARDWRERLRDAAGATDTDERPSHAIQRGDATHTRRRLVQQLRGDLDQILLTALRRDPARRYAGAQALGDDVRRYLAGHPIHARADRFAYRAAKFVRRNAVATAVAALLVLGLLAATVVSLSLARSERRARDEAELQARHALRTRDFVVSLFNDINPTEASAGKGKQYTAVELLSAAAARVDKQLADAPETQAELRAVLASSLLQLSDYEAGKRLADAAVTQLRAIYGKHHLMLADALVTRAQIQRNLSDLAAAKVDADAALIALDTLPAEREVKLMRIRALNTLATLAALGNDYEVSLRQNLAILQERIGVLGRDDDPGLAVDLNNVATVYQSLGRNAEAEATYRRAAELFAKANGEDHPRMAWLNNGIAFALLGQGKLDEAQRYSDRARDIVVRKLGPDNALLISIDMGQGRIARMQHDYVRAAKAFEGGIALAEKAHHPQTAAIELQYALALLDQRQYARAEALLAQSLTHTKEMVGDKVDASGLLARVAHGFALARLGRVVEGNNEADTAMTRLRAEFAGNQRHLREAEELYARIRPAPTG